MSALAKRPRGRPKGAKNKKTNLSHASVERICEYHKFNPAEKLIRIANGTDDQSWPQALQARATEKLFDAIHNKKQLPGTEIDGASEGQYEIVFIEAENGFALPGAPDAEGIEEVVRPEPLQRAGDTPQGWEDSICD